MNNESPFAQEYARQTGITPGNQPNAQADSSTESPFAQEYARQTGTKPSISNDPWTDFKSDARQVVIDRKLSPAILPVLLAQAADESARGTAANGNNYFGIKGTGTSGSSNLTTQEYGNGSYYNENANFATYNNPKDSINAYLDLVLSYPGVKEAVQSGSPDAIIKAIENGGYATSPTYVNTIESQPEFQQYLPEIGGQN